MIRYAYPALALAAFAPTTLVSCSSSCDDTGTCGVFSPTEAGAGDTGGGQGSGGGGRSGNTGGRGSGGTAGGSGSSGGSGGAGSGGAPTGGSGNAGDSGIEDGPEGTPPCDETGTPDELTCLATEDYAIFVAPGGTGTGTRDEPVGTIAAGLVAAKTAGKTRVIVCNGTFPESVNLTTAEAGIGLFGGFKCPTGGDAWARDETARPVVQPTGQGPALRVDAGNGAIVVRDFDFRARDALSGGDSSVGATVNASGNVALTRVRITAGNGQGGSDGVLVPFELPVGDVRLAGNDAVGQEGAGICNQSCTGGGFTRGGRGGPGGLAPGNGEPGLPALKPDTGGIAGQACAGPGGGKDGESATDSPAAPGASVRGQLTGMQWFPASGTDGTNGTPGQGGGGGAGALGTALGDGGTLGGGGGGGGACGGCGGAAGQAGRGGGASIALLVVNSTLALSDVDLAAGNAGEGGTGAAGQPGQSGGIGGNRFGAACNGGNGGRGASGGAAGGGAGGISVGILHGGAAPGVTEVRFQLGQPGAAGPGGNPGVNDGIAGVAENVRDAS